MALVFPGGDGKLNVVVFPDKEGEKPKMVGQTDTEELFRPLGQTREQAKKAARVEK